MSDGLWNTFGSGVTGSGQESIRQASLTRHKLLTINLSPIGNRGVLDSSSFGSVDPNALSVAGNHEGGPHFIFSPENPVGSKTYGFEWVLFTTGLFTVATPAIPAAGNLTVTIWELISNTQIGDSSFAAVWASFQPRVNVGLNELYHSFDINASAIRFQITNVVDVESSIIIGLSEL